MTPSMLVVASHQVNHFTSRFHGNFVYRSLSSRKSVEKVSGKKKTEKSSPSKTKSKTTGSTEDHEPSGGKNLAKLFHIDKTFEPMQVPSISDIKDFEEMKHRWFEMDKNFVKHMYSLSYTRQLERYRLGFLNQDLKNQCSLKLMVRQSFIDMLRKLNNDEIKKPTVLVGPAGSGKSSVMLQVVQNAWRQGWLTIYIPNPYLWINGRSKLEEAPRQKKVYIQPGSSLNFLKDLVELNVSYVDKITLTKAYTFGRETLAKGIPIKSLVNAISNHPSHVQSIVEAFMSELLAAREPGTKTLLAIDQLNCLFGGTLYSHPDKRSVVQTSELLLPRMVHDMFVTSRNEDLISIGALSSSNFSNASDSMVMQKIASNEFDSIHIDHYNQCELQSIVNFYKAHELLWNEGFHSVVTSGTTQDTSKMASSNLIHKLFTLTGGNPKKLAACSTSFLH